MADAGLPSVGPDGSLPITELYKFTRDGVPPTLALTQYTTFHEIYNKLAEGLKLNLHLVGRIGTLVIMKVFLKAGADPNQTDEEGLKPIEVAAAYGNKPAVELLFPLTSQVDNIPNWTVDGILEYMQSEYTQPEQYSHLYKLKIALPKEQSRATKELSDSTSLKKELLEVTPEAKRSAAEANSRGQDAFKRKEYQAAVDAFTQAITMNPADPKILSNRSLCYLHLDQPERALTDAKSCRALKPDWAKACYREGAALYKMEMFKEAANCFEEGLRLAPENKELTVAYEEALDAELNLYRRELPPYG